MSIDLRLRAYLIGFAQAATHRAWDTEGTYAIVEPRKDQTRGWDAGIAAFDAAEKQERARLAVEAARPVGERRG
jgi:hypothetical protein